MSAISMRRLSTPLRLLLVWSVRGYQTIISPALPRSCKYYPSCSQYAIDALTQYGVFRGVVLAGWRLLRCNPLSYGGYDPIERQRLFVPRRGGSGHSKECGCDASKSEASRDARGHRLEAGRAA